MSKPRDEMWVRAKDLYKQYIPTFGMVEVVLKKDYDKAVAALKFYAGLTDGKWEHHVCDSFSGGQETFDYDGDKANHPSELAIKTLTELGELPTSGQGEGE